MSTYQSAINHTVFKESLDYLIEDRFWKDTGIVRQGPLQEIDSEKLKMACWLATIIANSNEENDKYIAATFAKLLFLKYPNNYRYNKVAYVILSRTGNLLATNFLSELFNREDQTSIKFKDNFGPILDLELGSKRSQNSFEVLGRNYSATDFQKKLWKTLGSSNKISISAPTSAGKSFLIQNYLLEKFHSETRYFAVYIVPSRALIAQVHDTFRKILPEEIVVKTAFVENEEEPDKSIAEKELLVVTPERCLRLLKHQNLHPRTPDFLFIDEIQNVENEDSRGFLYEYVLDEIASLWSLSQIVTAGPFIKNSNNLFRKVLGENAETSETLLSPVYQMKVTVRPDNTDYNKVNFKVVSSTSGAPKEFSDTVNFDYLNLSENKTNITSKLVSLYGAHSQNIIYVPKTNYAESHALRIAEELDDQEVSEEISELISLVTDEVHPEYYLIDCLRKGIVFHHSKIPDIIRSEIEYLFTRKKVQHLVCTATLLEGVNLPAEKIFIPYPTIDRNELTLFEFGNLIGRAGRISTNLYGSIYSIEKLSESWSDDYYNNDYDKEINTASDKVLNTSISDVLDILNDRDVFSSKGKAAVSFLKHRYLKSREGLSDFLNLKDISEENKTLILEKLEQKLNNVTIPLNILKSNPTIDPELQNQLYNRIATDGVERWVLYYHDDFHRRMSREVRHGRAYRDKNFYGQLEVLFGRLNEIFDFRREAYFNHQIRRTLPQMILYAVQWLQNLSYKQLIINDLNFYANILNKVDLNDKKQVNRHINEIIKINSTVVTFILVKYFKLVTDILDVLMTPEQKEEFSFTLALPTMMELGTTKAVVLALISGGLPRSVAVRIFHLIPEDQHDDPIEWLRNQESLDISDVYVRFLRRKGFLKIPE